VDPGSPVDPRLFPPINDVAEYTSLAEIAYRFIGFEPDVNVTLIGTGDPGYADAYLDSFERGPFDPELVA
jgi:hypothetical protein